MSTNKYDNKFKKKFAELEVSLRKHEKNISVIVNDFLTNPQQNQLYWQSIKTKLNREYRELLRLNSEWAVTEIPRQYRFVLREQMAKAKSLKSITNEAQKTISQLLKSKNVQQIQKVLAQSAIDDISTGLLLGRRDINRLIAQTRQTLISESIIDNALIREVEAGNISASKILKRPGTVANSLMNAANNNRFITIIDKNGNPLKYRITYYSEMVFRTKWHDAQSQAVITNNKNWDTDLIRVSNHSTITEICQQFEGKIFSLTGKNKDFPVADDVPPYHPNCLHYITTAFEEALKVQKNYKQYSDFSKGKIDRPPGQETFIPIKKRNQIVDKTVSDIKTTDLYMNARPKRKRIIIRDSVSKALARAA
jgi:hypothetical protein